MWDIETIILASGEGTRLRPFSLDRPKGLLPICNRPLLARLLSQLNECGFRRATVALPPCGDDVRMMAAACAPPGFDLVLDCPDFPSPGSALTVRRIMGSGTSTPMVIYGDSLLSADFAGMARFHMTARANGAEATLLYHRPHDLMLGDLMSRTYHGILSIDENNRVTRFVEKPLRSEIRPGFDLANAAVFLCERSLLERAEFLSAIDFSFDIFEPAVNISKLAIFGTDIGTGFRFDIGSVERWSAFNLKMLNGELPGRLPGREVSPGFHAGEACEYALADIRSPVLLGKEVVIGRDVQVGPNAVIGDGCWLADGAFVRESILMENCRIGMRAWIDRAAIGPSCWVGNGVRLSGFTALGAFSALQPGQWP
ncbi:MAG: NDP-sugar synthase [Acidobacteria bacterium]|nr:NDP-sugar synthase [Acidobacteriota bacterium]